MPSAVQWVIVAAYIVGGIFYGRKIFRKLHNAINGHECHTRKSGRRFE